MKKLLIAIKWIIELIFRAKTTWGTLLKNGSNLLLGNTALAFFAVKIPTPYGALDFSYYPQGDASTFVFILAGCCYLLAFWIIIGNHQNDMKSKSKEKILAVELRGLQLTGENALEDAVNKVKKIPTMPLSIDIRSSLKNGVVTTPDKALERIKSFETQLQGFISKDISIALGGLAPIPFTFLTGMLVDDEHNVELWDWNREKLKWSPLNGTDDGKRFKINGVNKLPEGSDEVIVATSVSYPVDLPNIKVLKPSLPIVQLDLEAGDFHCHWSEAKQQSLANDFSNVIRQLKGKHIRKIHLFLAAPSSLTLRLGMTYDKRNFPECVIYQYEGSLSPAYPWGIQLPTHGFSQAQLV